MRFIVAVLVSFSAMGSVRAEVRCSEVYSLNNLIDRPNMLTIFGYLQFARQAESARNGREALGWYKEVLDLEPHHPSALSQSGYLLLRQGKAEQALPFLEKAWEVSQSDAFLFAKLLETYQSLGLSVRAEFIAQQAVRDRSPILAAHVYLVKNAIEARDWPVARQRLQSLQRRFPEELTTIKLQYQLALRTRDWPQAQATIKRLIERSENSRNWQIESIRLLGQMGRYEEQIRQADLYLQIEPNNAQVLRLKTKALISLGEYSEAVETLSTMPPTPALLKVKAQAYYHLGRMDMAYRTLVEVVREAPQPDLFVVAAIIKIEMGEVPLRSYQPSPLVRAIMDNLDPLQLKKAVQINDRIFWSFTPIAPAPGEVPIQNGFWQAAHLFFNPVDGAARSELVGPRYR